MKLLILGIDGGDERVFRKFEMPFYHQLMDQNTAPQLTEDLFSRGWVEMISGRHARDNLGFYLRPKLDGSQDFTLSYSFGDLLKAKTEDLIWELPAKQGHRVGIMNVPTTYPSPQVENGFFVSGAGGGLTKVEGIPDSMCSSAEIRSFLESQQYVVDLRLKPSGIEDTDVLFDRLEDMMSRRFDAFIELAKTNQIDFGFLALRAPTIVTYAGMYEVEHEATPKWTTRLQGFFRLLDSLTKRLFDELQPDHYVVTADHGVTSQKYHANYNVFLEEAGYLKFAPREPQPLSKRLRQGVSRLRRWASGTPFKAIGRKPAIDFSATTVFGHYYYNGLYVNDSRFGGAVDNVDELVDEVCEKFNGSAYAKKWEMKAEPYRRNYLEATFSDALPDIWINAPDEIYFMGVERAFVKENPWYRELSSLIGCPSTMLTGIKGRHPLFVTDNKVASLIQDEDPRDLTLVYKVTERVFENA